MARGHLWFPTFPEDRPVGQTVFALVQLRCLTPKTLVQPLEFRCHHTSWDIDPKLFCIAVQGGHLWFVTYAGVGQFSNLLHRVAAPQNVKITIKIVLLSCIYNQKYARFLTKPESWPPSWIIAIRWVAFVGSCTIEILPPRKCGARIGHASEFYSRLILWQNNLVPGTL